MNNVLPSVLEMGRKTKKKTKKRKKKNTKNPLGTSRNLCLMLTGLLLSAAIYLFIIKEFELAIVALLLVLGLLHYVVKEVREAWAAGIFHFGKYVGKVSPGLAFCLSPIWRLEMYFTGRQRLVLPKVTQYLKGGTELSPERVVGTFQINSISKIVRVRGWKERLVDVALAKMKSEIGKREFLGKKGVVEEQGGLEKAILHLINAEVKAWGCKFFDLELADYLETIHSKAEAEKVFAEAAKAKAKALAEPLEGNWPAAAAMIGTEGVKSLVGIFGKSLTKWASEPSKEKEGKK